MRGLDFNLEPEDVVVPDVCPVLGIPLGYGGHKDYAPSIDRIRNNRGYVKGNIVVVSWRANRIKSDCSIDEIVQVAKFYKRLVERD